MCCVAPFDQPDFCNVVEADLKRLGDKLTKKYLYHTTAFESLLDVIDHGSWIPALKTKWRVQKAGPFKGNKVCACICLEGDILHRVQCKVYDKRPRVCRVAIKPGSRTCHRVRRLYKLQLEDMEECRSTKASASNSTQKQPSRRSRSTSTR